MYNNFIRSPSPIRRVSSILLSRIQTSIPKNSRGFHKTSTTRRIFTPSTTTTAFQNNSNFQPIASLGAFSSPYLRSFRPEAARISYHFIHTNADKNVNSAHQRVIEDVGDLIFSDVPKVDVKKVLVVGSGGLSIGQAGEFDYSGNIKVNVKS
jgi:hypothetical protein